MRRLPALKGLIALEDRLEEVPMVFPIVVRIEEVYRISRAELDGLTELELGMQRNA